MPNSGKIYEAKCPSCGAPLQMSEERVTCNYCGAVLERERPPVETQTLANLTLSFAGRPAPAYPKQLERPLPAGLTIERC
jgi:DNA-directed RNA polymerase subunit RPC12/RpoP